MSYNSYQLYIEVIIMFEPKPMTKEEIREELLHLAEDLQSDVLLLECLCRADLSDCCEPAALESVQSRLHDYIKQHTHEIGVLARELVAPDATRAKSCYEMRPAGHPTHR